MNPKSVLGFDFGLTIEIQMGMYNISYRNQLRMIQSVYHLARCQFFWALAQRFILLLFSASVLFTSADSQAATCRSRIRSAKAVKELESRQKKIEKKYQSLGEAKIFKRLEADVKDSSIKPVLQKVAAKLLKEYRSQKTHSFEEYNAFARLFSQYLDFRFFREQIPDRMQDIWNKMKKMADTELQITTVPPESMPIKLFNFPGLTTFEQISEMRAYGYSPMGTIEKMDTVDGVPGNNIAQFRLHDDVHFQDWIRQLDSNERFYQIDLVDLILESSRYFEKLRSVVDGHPHMTIQVRRIIFFLYFFVSHETNLDIISSKRWLFHLLRNFDFEKQALAEKVIEDKIRNDELRTIFNKNWEQTMAELGEVFGWPWEKIQYNDFLLAVEIIRSVDKKP